LGATDRVVLEVARLNPTDATRMVAAFAWRELDGQGVSRKRVQRLMGEQRLLLAQALGGPAQAAGVLPGHPVPTSCGIWT
jgi:hypothetical protein